MNYFILLRTIHSEKYSQGIFVNISLPILSLSPTTKKSFHSNLIKSPWLSPKGSSEISKSKKIQGHQYEKNNLSISMIIKLRIKLTSRTEEPLLI